MQIAPGIYRLRQWMGGHVHAYLLDDGGELTLIDTLYDLDAHRVLRQIQRLGRQPSDLKHILITHAHRSHIGGLLSLKQLTGATVYAHEWEADILASEREAQRVSPVPKRPFRVYPIQLGLGKLPPCPPDVTVHHGDRIGPVEVVHAPGHTPGHLGCYWPERRAIFVGDAVATWPIFSMGWPGLNLNLIQCRRSLRRLADFDVEIVAVGHGEPIRTQGTQRLRELVAAIEQ